MSHIQEASKKVGAFLGNRKQPKAGRHLRLDINPKANYHVGDALDAHEDVKNKEGLNGEHNPLAQNGNQVPVSMINGDGRVLRVYSV
uniref:Uncharacterized protein n=1 Tax=Melanopsichium pennsylvanicum 4 TaxID=1398559 RepID=A0A077R6L4_9BASI|nr:uncharacterized protein BN887_06074 [Melanopsichium pennsylvanicum 4]